ncbi:hypothetical protein N9U64_01600 [Pseudomonadota bacterium]|nr:hypothetical protein [Pseudomonadota bacterium]
MKNLLLFMIMLSPLTMASYHGSEGSSGGGSSSGGGYGSGGSGGAAALLVVGGIIYYLNRSKSTDEENELNLFRKTDSSFNRFEINFGHSGEKYDAFNFSNNLDLPSNTAEFQIRYKFN